MANLTTSRNASSTASPAAEVDEPVPSSLRPVEDGAQGPSKMASGAGRDADRPVTRTADGNAASDMALGSPTASGDLSTTKAVAAADAGTRVSELAQADGGVDVQSSPTESGELTDGDTSGDTDSGGGGSAASGADGSSGGDAGGGGGAPAAQAARERRVNRAVAAEPDDAPTLSNQQEQQLETALDDSQRVVRPTPEERAEDVAARARARRTLSTIGIGRPEVRESVRQQIQQSTELERGDEFTVENGDIQFSESYLNNLVQQSVAGQATIQSGVAVAPSEVLVRDTPVGGRPGTTSVELEPETRRQLIRQRLDDRLDNRANADLERGEDYTVSFRGEGVDVQLTDQGRQQFESNREKARTQAFGIALQQAGVPASVANYVATADVNPGVTETLTTGGFVPESGDGVLGITDQRLQSASRNFGSGIPLVPTRREITRGQNNPVGNFIEGAALAARDLINAPQYLQTIETGAEIVESAPVAVARYGPGTVAETATGVGRRAFTSAVLSARNNPARFAGGLAFEAGAAVASGGTSALRPSRLVDEVDPRVGTFGTTLETRGVRRLLGDERGMARLTGQRRDTSVDTDVAGTDPDVEQQQRVVPGQDNPRQGPGGPRGGAGATSPGGGPAATPEGFGSDPSDLPGPDTDPEVDVGSSFVDDDLDAADGVAESRLGARAGVTSITVDTELDATPEPEVVQQPESQTGTTLDVEPSPDVDADAATATRVDTDDVLNVDTRPDVDTDTGIDVSTGVDTDTATRTDTRQRTRLDTDQRMDLDLDTDGDRDPGTDTDTQDPDVDVDDEPDEFTLFGRRRRGDDGRERGGGDVFATGWFSETVTDFALGVSLTGRDPAGDPGAFTPFGENPTEALAAGGPQISATLDVFGLGDGGDQ